MILKNVFLRWYKSFNEAFGIDREPMPWDKFENDKFPYVIIPIDELVTTIVGANESGKSHLLSAVSKTLKRNGLDLDRRIFQSNTLSFLGSMSIVRCEPNLNQSLILFLAFR